MFGFCLLVYYLFLPLPAEEQKISCITHGERVGVYGWNERRLAFLDIPGGSGVLGVLL
jgi:hypothetical protein